MTDKTEDAVETKPDTAPKAPRPPRVAPAVKPTEPPKGDAPVDPEQDAAKQAIIEVVQAAVPGVRMASKGFRIVAV